MAVNVGSASVTIMPSMSGFGAKMDKALSGAGASGGSSFSKAFGSNVDPAKGGILKRFRSAGADAGGAMADAAGKGIGAKGAAIAGAVGGLASSIGSTLIGAIGNLTGEMAAASDSAQKFASTLQFADLDTGTIDALTRSTQEYADKTVYDLTDIRNTTAQLAANGVKDYDRLAMAAGNLNAVAGGTSDTYRSVAMVMTQTAGQGKLTTENWNQLADAIPGASGKIQQALLQAGAYTGNFREAMEKGEISAEEFNAAIMDLGFQDAAVQAAESTATIEGAMGNLEAAAVGAGSKVIDAFKPFLTGGMSGAANLVTDLGNGISDFLGRLQDNGSMQAFADLLSGIWTVAGNVGGAVVNLAGALLGVQPGADVAASAASVLKAALDAAKPVIDGIANASAWLMDNAAQAAPVVVALAAGFIAFQAAQGVAGFVSAFSAAVSGVAATALPAAGGLTALAGGETAAGTAAGASASQVLALGAAVLMIGGGIALASGGMLLLANAAAMLASSGAPAGVAMVGLVAGIAALGVAAMVAGPALTAGSVGMLAFGAAVALVGAGVILASAGITVLSGALPSIASYGTTAATGIAALGVALVPMGLGATAAAAGLTLFGAGLTAAAAGATLSSAGVTLLSAGMGLLAGSVKSAASGVKTIGSSLPKIGSTAPAAAAGLTSFGAACSKVAAASDKFPPMASKAESAFKRMSTSAKDEGERASSAIKSACSQMQSSVSSMQLRLPRIQVGALPHFRMSGKFDPKSGSVPSVSVSWYAKGGLFGSPQVIGVGDNRRYDEAVLPLSPKVLKGIGEGVAQNSGASGGVSYNYRIDGITYDDGSNVAEAMQRLIRALRIERRR